MQSNLEAEIVTTALPNQTFKGTVLVVYPEATVQNGVTNYNVLLSVDNSAGLLKPGMTTTVSITVATHEDILYLPIEALKEVQGRDGVYLLPKELTSANSKNLSKANLPFNPVTVGFFSDNLVEITSGVAEGDHVLVALPNTPSKKSMLPSLGRMPGGGGR